MAIVRCPRCRDEVTVPPGATIRALVRCPLCLEQYLLSEALANAPPLLVIIGGEVPQAAIEQSAAEGHAVASGHDYQLAESFAHTADSHWGHAAAATLAPRAPTIRPGRIPRRREPNAILLTFSWVGGGLLSLVLAPLILWWIFKVDPVEIGPTVAAYVPWVVPQQFHGQANTPSADIETVAQPSRRRSKKSAPEEEPTITQKPSLADDQQSRPDLNASLQLAEPASSAIEAPTPADLARPRPPIPDLTDLLP
jgi:hypothetical protein